MKIRVVIFVILPLLFSSSYFNARAQTSNDSVDIKLQVGTPEPPTTPSSGGGGSTSPSNNEALIVTLKTILASTNSVTIDWQSNRKVLVTTRWGEDQRVDVGISGSAKYASEESVTVGGLKSNKVYWLELTFKTSDNKTQEFIIPIQTKKVIEVDPVSMPAIKFIAGEDRGEVYLSWVKSRPNADVRIVKSNQFFAVDEFSGTVVYEGPANQFKDLISNQVEPIFYTLFQLDPETGRYSNGIGQVVIPDINRNLGLIKESVRSLLQAPTETRSVTNISNVNILAPVKIAFCNQGQQFGNQCESTKIFEVNSNEEFAILAEIPDELNAEVVTLNIYDASLIKSNRIYLLHKDDDGVWKVRVPGLEAKIYDFSLQAYTRFGDLIYQESGSLRAVAAENPLTGELYSDSNNGWPMKYIALMNFMLLGILFMTFRSVLIAKKNNRNDRYVDKWSE